jgi:hypothetical protein
VALSSDMFHKVTGSTLSADVRPLDETLSNVLITLEDAVPAGLDAKGTGVLRS